MPKALDELRARLPEGTEVECVANTLRPELNGTRRRIIENRPTFYRFIQLTDADAHKTNHGTWPRRAADITWLDDHTVRFTLYRVGSRGPVPIDGHTLTLRLPN